MYYNHAGEYQLFAGQHTIGSPCGCTRRLEEVETLPALLFVRGVRRRSVRRRFRRRPPPLLLMPLCCIY